MRGFSPERDRLMANELTTLGVNLPQMSVTASGEATAIGVVQGDVRLEMGQAAITLLQQILGTQQSTSHAAEWALLDTERFNVFVLENEKYDCGAFSIGRRVALKFHTPEEYRDHFMPLTEPLIQELLNMPCLFAIKNQDFMTAAEYCPAFLGKLTQIQCQGENIRFRFAAFGNFRQQFINDNIRAFHLGVATVRNQLDVEHWSIRTGNLLNIAADMGIEIK